MSDKLSFVVEGAPRAKQSFRYAHGGGYQTASIKAWQDLVGYSARAALMNNPDWVSPPLLSVRLSFFLPTKRKIDLDNLSKAVLDGLNRIIFDDDSQVVELYLRKFVGSDNPRVVVSIGPGEYSDIEFPPTCCDCPQRPC